MLIIMTIMKYFPRSFQEKKKIFHILLNSSTSNLSKDLPGWPSRAYLRRWEYGCNFSRKGFLHITPTKQALIPRYWNCMLVSNRIVLPHGSVFRRLNLTLWGEGTPLAFRVLTRSYLTNVICHFPNPCEFPNCI